MSCGSLWRQIVSDVYAVSIQAVLYQCHRSLTAFRIGMIYLFICSLCVSSWPISLAQADLIDEARAADRQKDYVHALQLWKELDRQGSPEAHFMVGSMYLHGIGTAQRVSDGLQMIQSAAESGYNVAQYTLSGLFYEGKYLNRDVEKSEYWLGMAAENGHAPAQVTLSMRLSLSKSSQDRITALMWALLALYTLDERSPEYNLALTQRHLLTSILNADEILQATNAAQEWRRSHNPNN